MANRMLSDPGEAADREEAERLAIAALGFLAERPEALGRFLALTGIGPANLRVAAAETGFLAGVVEFLAGDETLLVAFAEDAGVPPERISAARRTLSGQA
jgi:hypothetical protein